MATTEPIRNLDDLQRLADYFLERRKYRDHVLIVLGVYTALRICDLLPLTWDMVYNERTGKFKSHIIVIEQKTDKERKIALNKQAVEALKQLYPHHRSKYIFENNRKVNPQPISASFARRVIKRGAEAVGIEGTISCHSLRKTLGYHMWQQNVSPVLLMEIYNHSDYNITKRYLGITQDELDEAYLGMEMFQGKDKVIDKSAKKTSGKVNRGRKVNCKKKITA